MEFLARVSQLGGVLEGEELGAAVAVDGLLDEFLGGRVPVDGTVVVQQRDAGGAVLQLLDAPLTAHLRDGGGGDHLAEGDGAGRRVEDPARGPGAHLVPGDRPDAQELLAAFGEASSSTSTCTVGPNTCGHSATSATSAYTAAGAAATVMECSVTWSSAVSDVVVVGATANSLRTVRCRADHKVGMR